MVIGIDNGYGYIKTAHTICLNGVDKLLGKTALSDNVLEVGGAYYAIGERRMPYLSDKTATQDHYLGTLAAIARELKVRGQTHVNAVLTQGLPYQFFDAQREAFRDYMLQNKELIYLFEGQEYTVKFQEAIVYPQCLPVICQVPGSGKKVGIDIGSGTVDVVVYLRNKLQRTESFTLTGVGTIHCVEEIKKAFIEKHGMDIQEWAIQEFMVTGDCQALRQEDKEFLGKAISRYVQKDVMGELEGRGMGPRFMQLVFCGGGATLVRRYGHMDCEGDKVTFIENIHANAQGYEKLTKEMLKRKKG